MRNFKLGELSLFIVCVNSLSPVVGTVLSIPSAIKDPLLPLCSPLSAFFSVVGGGLVEGVISLEFRLKASQTSRSPSKSDPFTPRRSGLLSAVLIYNRHHSCHQEQSVFNQPTNTCSHPQLYKSNRVVKHVPNTVQHIAAF